MKAARFSTSAFSLVEVVVALGLFSFCIVAIAGLLTVGLGSTRSVVNESSAVNLASSIFGAWQAQRSGSVSLTVPELFTNLPPLSSSGSNNFYFDANGVQTDGANSAALDMGYDVQANGSGAVIDSALTLTFRWPVTSSTNAQQTRTFQRVFVK